MVTALRTGIACMTILAIILNLNIALAEGEWATNADGEIYTNSVNVGIGTSNPQGKLHVSGDFTLGHNNSVNFWDGSKKVRVISGYANYHYGHNLQISPGNELIVGSGESGNIMRGQGFATGRSETLYITSDKDIQFWVDLQDPVASDRAMTIANTGNVGIGTTNPQSKLAVNGTITAREIKVTDGGWADFVFDETYELPSLKSVESYIQKHKHLPDIPSAKDVTQQGIAVSEMLALHMQKIEELTLYLIKMKKENDSLRATVVGQNKLLSDLKKLRQRIEALELRK